MRRWVLQPKIFMTAWIFLCCRRSHILSGRSHAQTSCVIKKGLYLHNSNTHKRNTFQYDLTVPPGGQTVLLPQCHRMFFLLSPFICCFLFFLWYFGDVLKKQYIYLRGCVMCHRERGRKKKGTYRCIQAVLPRCFGTTKSVKKKNSVFFIKEYFYCYFVVKRRECISLDCMSWELSGRFDHLIQQMTKC